MTDVLDDGTGGDTDLDEQYRRSDAGSVMNTSPRLDAHLARTQTALDLFALLTLWIVLVPLQDFQRNGVSEVALIARIGISAIYGIDMTIRARLAPHHLRYVRTHPLGLMAVIFPPIRVLFSLRLIQGIFRKGNVGRFLIAATVLFLNGAIIVYFVERGAAGAKITTFGGAIWWSVVTVTTVGYGDLYPVTTYGRVVATFVMLIGLLTLAVVTANVSSNFHEQARRTRDAKLAEQQPVQPAATPVVDAEVSLAELRQLRDRLNVLLGDLE